MFRKAQAVAFRFVAGEFRPCLLPPPALCGRKTKALTLLQRASKPARAAHCLSPAHRRFVPGVEDNLQIWPQSRNSIPDSNPRNGRYSGFFYGKNEWNSGDCQIAEIASIAKLKPKIFETRRNQG